MILQQRKKDLRRLLGLLICGFSFLGCQSLIKNSAPNSRLLVSVKWVQSSLAHPNEGFRKINRMSPLLYKDLVLVGNALDGLVAYQQDNGQEVWRINIPYGVEASGVVIKDRLFIGANNGRLYSVDLQKHEILWNFDTKSEVVSEPLLIDGVLYFLSASQSLFAVDAVTGKQLWTYNRQDTSNLMTIRGGSRPAFANGNLYVGFSDGSLVSFNAKTGTQQWEITLNKNSRFKDIDSSPVIDGDLIYINSYDDKLYCVSKNKGEIIWSYRGGGISTPLIVGDRVLFSTSRGELIALTKNDGHEVWKYRSDNGIITDPTLYKGFIVVGESQGSLVLLDTLDGKVKGTFEPGRGIFSKPTAQPELQSLYFISGEGNAYSVKAEVTTKASIEYLRQ